MEVIYIKDITANETDVSVSYIGPKVTCNILHALLYLHVRLVAFGNAEFYMLHYFVFQTQKVSASSAVKQRTITLTWNKKKRTQKLKN